MVRNLPAMQETWVRSLGWEDPLEKRMATHSSILAERILWTEEPSGLQSMESQESDTTEQLILWGLVVGQWLDEHLIHACVVLFCFLLCMSDRCIPILPLFFFFFFQGELVIESLLMKALTMLFRVFIFMLFF